MKAWTYIIAATVCVALSVTFLTTPAPSTAQDGDKVVKVVAQASATEQDKAVQQSETLATMQPVQHNDLDSDLADKMMASIFQSLGLPFDGQGSLYVLNTGALVIQVDALDDPASDEKEAIVFQIAPEGLLLVDANSHWHLDRNNDSNNTTSSLQKQVPSEPDVTIIKVFDGDSQQHSLLTVIGRVHVEFDSNAGLWTIQAQDESQTYDFTSSFALNSQIIANFRSGCRAADCDNDGSVEDECTGSICFCTWWFGNHSSACIGLTLVLQATP